MTKKNLDDMGMGEKIGYLRDIDKVPWKVIAEIMACHIELKKSLGET